MSREFGKVSKLRTGSLAIQKLPVRGTVEGALVSLVIWTEVPFSSDVGAALADVGLLWAPTR